MCNFIFVSRIYDDDIWYQMMICNRHAMKTVLLAWNWAMNRNKKTSYQKGVIEIYIITIMLNRMYKQQLIPLFYSSRQIPRQKFMKYAIACYDLFTLSDVLLQLACWWLRMCVIIVRKMIDCQKQYNHAEYD